MAGNINVIMVVPSWGKRCGIAEYSKDLVDELSFLGCNLRVLAGNEWEYLSAAQMHQGVIIHFQYEYVLYTPWGLSQVIRRLAAANARFLFTVHDFSRFQETHNTVIRGLPCHIIVHSGSVKSALNSLGIPPGHVTIIPMGAHSYDPGDPVKARDILGLRTEKAIGFFGFAMAQKGVFELAEATRMLRGDYPGLKLFLFSSSPFFDEGAQSRLVSGLAERQLLENVVIKGEYIPVPQIVQFLHAMDVNVFPYLDSGFLGTSAACRVAMAARRPIITTDIPYFSDLQNEVLKIPGAAPHLIASAVRSIMGNPDLARNLVAACERYLKVNSWRAFAARHLNIYTQILHEKQYAQGTPTYGMATLPPERPAVPTVPEWMWRRVVERFGRR